MSDTEAGGLEGDEPPNGARQAATPTGRRAAQRHARAEQHHGADGGVADGAVAPLLELRPRRHPNPLTARGAHTQDGSHAIRYGTRALRLFTPRFERTFDCTDFFFLNKYFWKTHCSRAAQACS